MSLMTIDVSQTYRMRAGCVAATLAPDLIDIATATKAA
jgi:hypothetical protein